MESSDHVRGGQKGWWSHQIMLGVDTRAGEVSWAYLHSLEAYKLKIRSARVPELISQKTNIFGCSIYC